MADKYEWSDENIQLLRGYTQSIHEDLVDIHKMVVNAIAAMGDDSKWSGHYKIEFLEWMDLLRQYHAKLADPGVVLKAVQVLDQFLADWSGYYDAAESSVTLRSV